MGMAAITASMIAFFILVCLLVFVLKTGEETPSSILREQFTDAYFYVAASIFSVKRPT